MVELSQAFDPPHLVGVTIDPKNAFNFDFIIHKGDRPLPASDKPAAYKELVKYFLSALAIPDENQWVNLSPYEGNRMIKDDFGSTEMGRDLLAQDYLLKQITATMLHPDSVVGKKFWSRIYEQTYKRYGTTNVPVNTFNKIWIIPDKAIVYEKGYSAYIVDSHLKVMTERDYLSIARNSIVREDGAAYKIKNGTVQMSSQIVKEIIIPEIEREVNEGNNFAQLRQIVGAMELATWYKKALKKTLLGTIYADQSKVKGVDQDSKNNDVIYKKYIESFKKGAFKLIREEYDHYSAKAMPRKYFSGGIIHPQVQFTSNESMASRIQKEAIAGQLDSAQVIFNLWGGRAKERN